MHVKNARQFFINFLSSFPVRTRPSVSELHRFGDCSPITKQSFADYYCRWGIAPRPKEYSLFYYYKLPPYKCQAKSAHSLITRELFKLFVQILVIIHHFYKREYNVERTAFSYFGTDSKTEIMFFKHTFYDGKS